MAKDFKTDVLPTGIGGFFPTATGKLYQLAKWSLITDKMLAVLAECMRGNALPGWMLEKGNIVIAFWPKSSIMNGMYGNHALSLPAGSNSSIRYVASSAKN